MRQEIMLLSYKQIITIHRFSHYEAKFLLWEIDRERFLTTMHVCTDNFSLTSDLGLLYLRVDPSGYQSEVLMN